MNKLKYDYTILTPFKLCVLENFPFIEADFDALTNYQIMCKMVEYMNSISKNQNLVQTNMIELNNWFNNLDVQDEINNKLDSMAESGQLTDIIAQYLQLAGVLAYNTKNEMKNAENVVNGSICKTLGDEYNDGKGSFYKIRTITSSDVVDDVNIISLNFSDTLIAEKIYNNNFEINYYLGAYHKKYSELDKRIYLLLSNDSINFTQIKNIEIHGESSSGGGDPSIIYDKNTGYFLIAYSNQDIPYSFTIMRSKNLIDWTEHQIELTLPQDIQGWNKWGPQFFRDRIGQLYVIFSADKTQNGFDFENLITQCTDVENLTFTTPYKINRDDKQAAPTLYDCSIIYKNNKYYLVASDFNVIRLYSSTDLINFNLLNANIFDYYYLGANNENALEGCRLNIVNDDIMIYAEMPNISREVVGRYDVTNNKLYDVKVLNSLQEYKNGTFIKIDNAHEKFVVNNIAKDIVNENYLQDTKKSILYLNLTDNLTINDYTLQPNQLLVINTFGHKLKINKIHDPYKLCKLQYVIYDAKGDFEIGQYEDDIYSSYSYHANSGTNKKLKTIDFRFNACDDTYDYLDADSGIIDLTLNSGITGNIYCRKIGHVVNIQGAVDGTFSYGYLLTTLPDGFRPNIELFTPITNRGNEDSLEHVGVNPNGNIIYVGYDTSGTTYINITYLV